MKGKRLLDASDLARSRNEDLFDRVRSDEELAVLVSETARRNPRPYAELLSRLVGTPSEIDRDEARRFWFAAVENRREMSARLGRRIHLRVAAIDLLSRPSTEKRLKPVFVPQPVLDRLLASATTDGLTGAVNRETFLSLLGHELVQRRGHPPVIAFLDLDGFKAVNDTHGHERGDSVLAALARSAVSHLRRGDVLARVGGDEFAIMFVEASEADARAVLARIENAFRTACRGLAVGFSVGVVAAKRNEAAASQMKRADAAMYQHKRTRRPAPAVSTRREHVGGVALFATTRGARIAEFSRHFATWGYSIVPAASEKVVLTLVPLLEPRVVLADLLFPPNGGERLLRAIPSASGTSFRALVAPSRWRHVGRSTPLDVLPYPAGPLGTDALFRRMLRTRFAPIAPLPDKNMASAVARAIAALVDGRPLDRALAAAVGGRAEIDLVRRVLGT